MGSPVLRIEELQAACPALEELCINGLGGGRGWMASPEPARPPGAATLPCWPALRVLRVSGIHSHFATHLGAGDSHVTTNVLLR
jgi:hypothetical protein